MRSNLLFPRPRPANIVFTRTERSPASRAVVISAWIAAGCGPSFSAADDPADSAAVADATRDVASEAGSEAVSVSSDEGGLIIIHATPHDAASKDVEQTDGRNGPEAPDSENGDTSNGDANASEAGDAAQLNPCETDASVCNPNAMCSSAVPGRATCMCKPGYSGTGTACVPIDSGAVNPCAANNGGCPAGATCTQTAAGKSSCACPSGQTACAGACVNETTNDTPNAPNCGGCGASFTCTGGQICAGGACACSPGTVRCSNICPAGASCVKATDISLGEHHACALLSAGTLACWGADGQGELGNGMVSNATFAFPRAVLNVSNVIAVAAAGAHTCAVAGDTWKCWGDNSSGQIGTGGDPTLSPTALISGATVFTTGYNNSCMVVSQNVQCMGYSRYGVLGTTEGPNSCAVANDCAQSPVDVRSQLLGGVTAIAISDLSACAIVTGGDVVCWGDDSYGQIGPNGATSSCPDSAVCSPAPVAIPGVTGATAIAAGNNFMCALLRDATVRCWGDNSFGELGSTETASCLNLTTPCSSSPLPVNGLAGVTQIAAGEEFACALLNDGTVDCWGQNSSGQLGNASVTAVCQSTSKYVCSTSPVPVSGVAGAVAIAAGGDFACAVLGSGGVVCWGNNQDGQLGNGNTAQPVTAVTVQF